MLAVGGKGPEHQRDIPAATGRTLAETCDVRFRVLLGEEAWSRLPSPVQRRFSKLIAPGVCVRYSGQVTVTSLSLAGRVLAYLTRVIGGPLPSGNGATGPADVEVKPDGKGGQEWRRTYPRPGRRPQAVYSSKRFQGPTGLEEHVGGGIGMALVLSVEDGALTFRSDHYFFQIGGLRFRLPRALWPGSMCISHRNRSETDFTFELSLTHPWLGQLLHQRVEFSECHSPAPSTP